ncbi:monoamine oxidase [Pseudomonas putida]|nr:monoamine oxidase [Pseudomonas putida]
MQAHAMPLSRRQVLHWIGATAGAAAMYQAMSALAFAGETPHHQRFALSGAPQGARILILGAGLAGMTAAYELRKAGYQVKLLEYNAKPGGRCWTLRGGDRFVELGGATQNCTFDQGLYLNPGPWRIPYHHHAVLDYCHRFGVALEPFIQVNYNAMVHSTKAFAGKPVRYRAVQSDFQGHIAELLSKAINQNALDQALTAEDRQRLLEAMRSWGALDASGSYKKSLETSLRRGFAVDAGGGLMSQPVPSDLLDRKALLDSNLWQSIAVGQDYEFQTSLFQPVGGMDQIAQAFEKQVGDLIRYNAKVTAIEQNDKGVTVTYQSSSGGGASAQETADWCVCTLPLSILGQLPVQVSAPMMSAIRAVPYEAAVKVGLQFKRRFWEQDERIYGGISYTDTPIGKISYPSTDYGKPGKGVLLGGYLFGPNAYEFTAMAPEVRVRKAVEYGALIHPQYHEEFDNGIAVGWHRVPWTNGCYGLWTEALRQQHYQTLCQIDGRIVLAGEHASRIPAWMEGAILSSLDAIKRLHTHIVASHQAA